MYLACHVLEDIRRPSHHDLELRKTFQHRLSCTLCVIHSSQCSEW
jgi:hypothetical protein